MCPDLGSLGCLKFISRRSGMQSIHSLLLVLLLRCSVLILSVIGEGKCGVIQPCKYFPPFLHHYFLVILTQPMLLKPSHKVLTHRPISANECIEYLCIEYVLPMICMPSELTKKWGAICIYMYNLQERSNNKNPWTMN